MTGLTITTATSTSAANTIRGNNTGSSATTADLTVLQANGLLGPHGLGYPINLSLTASAAAGALTIAIKGNNGSDPSATNPVVVSFRNATGTTGDATNLSITAATSLVISSGSTLGVTSSTAFRIWVVLFNDGGTARIGAINCSTLTANAASQIYPLSEYQLVTSTAEGGAGGADSAGVFYTGTQVTTKAYRILGYLEWSLTGLTAGTWTTDELLKTQLMGPGILLPGQVVQAASVSTATETATTSSTFQACTNLSKALTLTSAANLLRSILIGTVNVANQNTAAKVTVAAAGTAIGQISLGFNGAGSLVAPCAINQLSKPNSISSVTYDARVASTDNATSVNFPETTSGGYGTLELQEIMG